MSSDVSTVESLLGDQTPHELCLLPAVWMVNRLLGMKGMDSHSTLKRRLLFFSRKVPSRRLRPGFILFESILLGFSIYAIREVFVSPLIVESRILGEQSELQKLHVFQRRLLDAGHRLVDISSFTRHIRAKPELQSRLPNVQTGIAAALVGLCVFPLNPLIIGGFALVVGTAEFCFAPRRRLDLELELSKQDWVLGEPSTVTDLESLYDTRAKEEKEERLAQDDRKDDSTQKIGQKAHPVGEDLTKLNEAKQETKYDTSDLLRRLNLERTLRQTNWEMAQCREDLITVRKALTINV